MSARNHATRPASADADVERFVPGGAFVLDAPDHVPAVWGDGETVAWAQDEALWLVGPAGVGKTTIEGQLVRGRLGLDAEFLGMPVKTDERKVLVLALDRPRQIARNFRRIFDESERQVLEERLEVWSGPLLVDLVADPSQLAKIVRERGAGTLFIDSAKDLAAELSRDDVGSAVNRAIQLVLAEGCEVCVLHHQRKAQANNPKPKKLADVFGSAWLTAGAGSVVLVWGEPGDPLVELRTLKPAAGEIGPLQITHDHETGRTSAHERTDLVELTRSTRSGLAVSEAATSLYGEDFTKADRERARRQLDKLTKGENAPLRRVDGDPPRYVVRDPRDPQRDPLTRQVTPGTKPHEQAARRGSRTSRTPSGHGAPLIGGACQGA